MTATGPRHVWSCRRQLVSCLAITLVWLAMMPAAAAQEAPDLVILDVQTERRDVTISVVAPDGLRDRDITPSSFEVEIADQLVTPTASRIAGAELDVVLLVDVSGSMTADALAAAKAAGASFVDQLPDQARVAVVSFGDEALVRQPFTTDASAVVETLGSLVAQGETALYAAVLEAARQFDPGSDSSRTVVLLSDGGNTVDESSLGNAQAALATSDAVLHAISIQTDEANEQELESLAEASGGTVAKVDDLTGVEALYREIAVDLGNQYRLVFEAPGNGQTAATVRARANGVVLAETSFLVTLPEAAEAVAPIPTPFTIAPTPTPVPLIASAPNITSFDAADNTVLKWGSIGALAAAIAASGVLILSPGGASGRQRRLRPAERFAVARADTAGSAGRVAGWLTAIVDRFLSGRRIGPWITNLLDSAGWKIRTSEFVVLLGLSMVAGFFLGALSSFGRGLGFAFAMLACVIAGLSLKVARRRSAFADQLNATLQMMAGALRTGYSLPQVISLVGQEAESPTSEEFNRMAVEMRLGRDLADAIRDTSGRMKNADFLWASGAIEIAREVGGDLAEVLDNVAGTVRTRERVRRQIMALSAEGRVSAWILIGLPFPVFFWQLAVNREYTELLFNNPLGLTIFISAITVLIAGTFWLRYLIKVDY